MIDPGHPFSVPFEQLVNALETSLREGVEQPASLRLLFDRAQTAYDLPAFTLRVTRVTGFVDQRFAVFTPERDYRYRNQQLIWQRERAPDTPDVLPRQPDNATSFEVEYTYRERPTGLTDFNEGSVSGTLIRAVAREFKLLYEQTDQAYRRAFLDVATGVALDNVVALLGVTRNAALKASGTVTFLRNSAATQTITIPVGTRVADASNRIFVTIAEGRIPAEPINETVLPVSGVIRVANRIARLEELPAGLTTQDTAPDAPFGSDERTLTLVGDLPPGEVTVRYLPKSVRIPVEAQDPGPDGNVRASTVVVMPTPPPGINGVINEAPITGGQLPEADDQLRERARHALERSGNATLNALRVAILGVDGVADVEVVDRSSDETIAPGEVQVRYAFTAGDQQRQAQVRQQVLDVIEQTRAAGILVRLTAIRTVLISGTFYVIAERDAPAAAVAQLQRDIVQTIATLGIGDPLLVPRLRALVYRVPGLADSVAEQLERREAGQADRTSLTGATVTAAPTEQLRPDEANLRVVLLQALRVVGVQNEADRSMLTLQLHNASGPASVPEVQIELVVTVRAGLRNEPTRAPETVGSFTRSVTFAPTATLTIAQADLDRLRIDDHNLEQMEVTIRAAIYEGLVGDQATIASG